MNSAKVKSAIKKFTVTEKHEAFGKWLLSLDEQYYYMANNGEAGIFLLRKDKSFMVELRFCIPSENVHNVVQSPLIIEVSNIVSCQKGRAKNFLNKLKNISKEIEVPVVLFTHTPTLVKYFKKRGFKSQGQLGSDEEYLMTFI
ncbi:hypothetical protein [Bacillus sp. 1P06AnD]|uniref:hypothetical protein n=1 Tax=Bacillus sp. 1P06AnD TaxID=3132208 RepID=UPI00399FB9D8